MTNKNVQEFTYLFIPNCEARFHIQIVLDCASSVYPGMVAYFACMCWKWHNLWLNRKAPSQLQFRARPPVSHGLGCCQVAWEALVFWLLLKLVILQMNTGKQHCFLQLNCYKIMSTFYQWKLVRTYTVEEQEAQVMSVSLPGKCKNVLSNIAKKSVCRINKYLDWLF